MAYIAYSSPKPNGASATPTLYPPPTPQANGGLKSGLFTEC